MLGRTCLLTRSKLGITKFIINTNLENPFFISQIRLQFLLHAMFWQSWISLSFLLGPLNLIIVQNIYVKLKPSHPNGQCVLIDRMHTVHSVHHTHYTHEDSVHCQKNPYVVLIYSKYARKLNRTNFLFESNKQG